MKVPSADDFVSSPTAVVGDETFIQGASVMNVPFLDSLAESMIIPFYVNRLTYRFSIDTGERHRMKNSKCS